MKKLSAFVFALAAAVATSAFAQISAQQKAEAAVAEYATLCKQNPKLTQKAKDGAYDGHKLSVEDMVCLWTDGKLPDGLTEAEYKAIENNHHKQIVWMKKQPWAKNASQKPAAQKKAEEAGAEFVRLCQKSPVAQHAIKNGVDEGGLTQHILGCALSDGKMATGLTEAQYQAGENSYRKEIAWMKKQPWAQ